MRLASRFGLFAGCLLAFVSSACGGAVDGDDPAHDTRFIGQWLIEDATRDAYAVYDLSADGRVTSVTDHGYSGLPYAFPRFEDRAGNVRCEFGASWTSDDGSRLRVGGRCLGASARDIVLDFPADRSQNSRGTSFTVVDVGGESGWQIAEGDVTMRRCATAEDCKPRR